MKHNTSAAENFAELLEKSLCNIKAFEGQVLKGTVVAIEKDMAVIDVGLKSEGRVSLREFGVGGQEVKVGDTVEVYVERLENRDGEIVISREKARREAAWESLEEAFNKKERVLGVITSRVKGGFTVDLLGASAFLPGSQIDVRPIKDSDSLMNIEQPFLILKMDRLRGNIVVSRRAILEESRAEARSEIMSTIQPGNVLEGIVKNLTDYGAFVDLGGIDGLLHVTDISWSRVGHPSEALSIGQTVQVKVIRVSEGSRISLGMKQLEEDPWKAFTAALVPGTEIDGTITSLMDYGVFAEVSPGVEGLIHSSELSWTRKSVPTSKVVSAGDKVRVRILDVDFEKHRLSLSLKQCMENPWRDFAQAHPLGEIVEGEVKNATEFGLFVELANGLDGLIYLTDLSWDQDGEEAMSHFKKGDKIKVKVLEVDVEKERIRLGYKQLTDDPYAGLTTARPGEIATCTVQKILENGLEVMTDKGLLGFIKKGDLAKDRSEQRPERFAVGERFDAQVLSVESKSRKLLLSIKAREVAEERQAMAEFGSSDSGASLGDILGAAIDLSRVKEKKATKKASVETDVTDLGALEEENSAPKKKSKKTEK